MFSAEASAAGDSGAIRAEPIDAYRWRLPRHGRMHVDGLVYADRRLMRQIMEDGGESLKQVENVACLPGIVNHSIAMPDIHWGYGFAIGGVAAFDPEEDGVVSPGGVGYDINCGVRLLRSDLDAHEVRPRLADLMNQIMRDVPAGVGSRHVRIELDDAGVTGVLRDGARWVVEQGFGEADDLERIEAGGAIDGADPERVGARARERGRKQLGTVGSGNHFIEVGYVDEVYDGAVAERFGLAPGNVTVFIHSGSRGLGYQVCADHLDVMVKAAATHDIDLPDRQLACAPLASGEAKEYIGAMNAAANFAFGNRQMMTHHLREAFSRVLGRAQPDHGLSLVYDVAHNMAKWETHEVDGRERRLCVHRKGATRAFPAGHAELPPRFRDVGQPVLIPGDMARYSFVLVGTKEGYAETFGSRDRKSVV